MRPFVSLCFIFAAIHARLEHKFALRIVNSKEANPSVRVGKKMCSRNYNPVHLPCSASKMSRSPMTSVGHGDI